MWNTDVKPPAIIKDLYLIIFTYFQAIQKENSDLREMLRAMHEKLEITMSNHKIKMQNLESQVSRLAGSLQDAVGIHRDILNTLQT